MDAAQLIYEVKKRRPLWDLFDKKNCDKRLIIQLWEEVSMELDEPTDEIKRKWKNLRDSYRIVLKRERNAKLQGFTYKGKKWKHTDDLYFLKDVMTTDPLHGGSASRSRVDDTNDLTNTSNESRDEILSTNESRDEILSNNSKQNNDFNNEMNDGESGECPFPEFFKRKESPPPPPRKKEPKSPLQKKEREREKNEVVEKRSPLKRPSEDKLDGDYNFLISFLPIMKEMTNMQKLEFRAEMSNVTLNIMRSAPTIVNEDIGFEDPSSSCLKQNWK